MVEYRFRIHVWKGFRPLRRIFTFGKDPQRKSSW